MEDTQEGMSPQNFQTPRKEELGSKSKRKSTSSSTQVVSSRFTRSRIAPDWAMQEILTLVRETVAIDTTFLRALPSIQKWKMISEHCAAFGVVRSSEQCHRKWESLLAEYKKIKDWESQPGVVSYWSLDNERKMDLGLPNSFDEELFRSVDDNLKAPGDRSVIDPDSESEAEVEMLTDLVDSQKMLNLTLGSQKMLNPTMDSQKMLNPTMGSPKMLNPTVDSQKMLIPIEDTLEMLNRTMDSQKMIIPIADSQEMPSPTTPAVNSGSKRQRSAKSREKGRVGRPKSKIIEAAVKTRENIELIHSILNGDGEKKDIALNELRNPGMLQMELVRRQGDNLIDVLGGLVEKLDKLYDLVEERG